MNEARRQAYLRALGIDCYVRRELAGAALSSSDDATLTAPRSPAESPVPTAAPIRQARELLADVGSPSLSRAAGIPAQPAAPEPGSVVPVEEPGGDVEQLRFSLQFHPVTATIAVISEIPFLGNERIHQGTGKLLLAILRALNLPIAELPRPDRFNWPLAADDDASAGRAPEAGQALQGFLRKRLETGAYQQVLVFGDRFRTLFAAAGVDEQLAGTGVRVIHTHSLGAMLQVPALKRTVWEQVRVVSRTEAGSVAESDDGVA